MITDFNDILGNPQIKKALRKSVLENKLLHAYIFEGAEGSGKTSLANSFARLIFCKTKDENCGCHSCVQFEAQSHSDLIYLNRTDKSKSIGVAPIRAAVSELSKKPFEYEHKLFIIEEAEIMTTEAQNALLRSIEEPPGYAVFILLANSAANLLPTVRSRCFTYKMQLFDVSEVFGYLKAHGYPEDKSRIACAYCGGSIGKAISLCESDMFFELRTLTNSALSDYGGDLERLFRELRLDSYKDYTDWFITLALIWYRDILVYKSTGIKENVYQSDYLTKVIECSKEFSFKRLYNNIKSVLELKKSLLANMPFSMAVDAFTLRLGEN